MAFYIRPIRIEDAEDINLLRRMPGVFETILGIPSERVARNKKYIENLDENTHQFVAVTEIGGRETVVGTAGLTLNQNPRLRHSGVVGIMVHKDYQGEGIGRALLSALLDVADNWLMLVRVYLEVMTDNDKAIKLYESLGFEIEGRKKMAAVRGGVYVDEYIMGRIHPNMPQNHVLKKG